MALEPYSADSSHPITEGLTIEAWRVINRSSRSLREPTRGVILNLIGGAPLDRTPPVLVRGTRPFRLHLTVMAIKDLPSSTSTSSLAC
jgi:hypothetical protein